METDENGMYKDVNVMEIGSDDQSNPQPKNKKNPTTDIEQFFKPAKHVKGDKRGWRQCKACTYVNSTFHLLISQLFVGAEMGAALKLIASWLTSIPHFGGTWLHYTRCVARLFHWLS